MLCMSDDAFDEFSFLPELAAEISSGPVPPVRRMTLDLPDGRALSALRFGDTEPQITLLHGAGLNAHTWDTTLLALGAPAVAVDLAGHGDSTWRNDLDYTPHTLADDVVRGMRMWTTAPQVLVGHSLGGLTAAAVTAMDPDLVRALVLIDITPGVDPSAGPQQVQSFFAGPTDWASRDELVERAQSFGFGGSRRATERGVYLNSRVREDGRVEWKHHFAHLAAMMANTPQQQADPAAGSTAPTMADTLSVAVWSDLESVAVPVTLIRGDQGYVTEADLEQFRARLPRASVVTVPAHHNVHEEIPVRLAELLRDVIGEAP